MSKKFRNIEKKAVKAERNARATVIKQLDGKVDLWVIAAGKGTRMGDTTIPKALVEIDGKSNLQNTLEVVSGKFRKIFVVVAEEFAAQFSSAVYTWFLGCNDQNIEIVPIESGGGDGKAVLEAYVKVTRQSEIVTDRAVILWGDAHLRSGDIVDELLAKMHGGKPSMIIPTVMEDNPYVAINMFEIPEDKLPAVQKRMEGMKVAVSADFIKYGEQTARGLHDQSIFDVSWSAIIPALSAMMTVNAKSNPETGVVKFTTQSGELTFLNIVHYLYNSGDLAFVYETEFPLMGYNTREELEDIRDAIKKAA